MTLPCMTSVLLLPAVLSLAVVAGCECKGASPAASGGAATVQSAAPGVFAAAPGVPAATPQYLQIGSPMSADSAQPVTVAALMAKPDAYQGRPVRVTGTVDSICESKGCWATLKDPASAKAEPLFVKFTCPAEETGRVVPMEAKGRPAIVEGVVSIKTITEAEARHYAQDAGKPQSEINKIVGPQREVSMQAPSVRIAM